MPKRKRPEEEFLADLRPLKRRLTWREALERIYQEYPKGSGLERNVIASGLKSIYSVGKLETKIKENRIALACRNKISEYCHRNAYLFQRGNEYILIDNNKEDEFFDYYEKVDEDGNYVDENFSPPPKEEEDVHEEKLEGRSIVSPDGLSFAAAFVFILKKNVGECLLQDEIVNRIRDCVKNGEIKVRSSKFRENQSNWGISNDLIQKGTIYFNKYVIKRNPIDKEKLLEWRKRHQKSNGSVLKYMYYVERVEPKLKRKELTRPEASVYILKKSKEESLIPREIYDEIKKNEENGDITLKKIGRTSGDIGSSLSESVRKGYSYFGKFRINRRKITRKKVNKLKRKYGKDFKTFRLINTKYEYILEEFNPEEENEDIIVSPPPSVEESKMKGSSDGRTASNSSRRRRTKRRKKKKSSRTQEFSVKRERTEEEEKEKEENTSNLKKDDDFDFSTIKIKKEEEYDEDEDDEIEEKDDRTKRLMSSQPLPFFDDEDE